MTLDESRRFELGTVARNLFSAWGANFGVFALLGVLLAILPELVTDGAQMLLARSTSAETLDTGQFGSSTAVVVRILGLIVVYAASYVLQAAILRGTVEHLNGRKARLADCLATGLKNLLPLFGLAIVSGLAIGLGFILLVIPGLILLVMWMVAAPVLVVERRGVSASLSRSRDLTRDHRWKVFLLLLIYTIVLFVTVVVVQQVSDGVFRGIGGALGPYLEAAAMAVAQGALALFGGIGVACVYHQLRVAKEGVGASELARVFE